MLSVHQRYGQTDRQTNGRTTYDSNTALMFVFVKYSGYFIHSIVASTVVIRNIGINTEVTGPLAVSSPVLLSSSVRRRRCCRCCCCWCRVLIAVHRHPVSRVCSESSAVCMLISRRPRSFYAAPCRAVSSISISPRRTDRQISQPCGRLTASSSDFF